MLIDILTILGDKGWFIAQITETIEDCSYSNLETIFCEFENLYVTLLH